MKNAVLFLALGACLTSVAPAQQRQISVGRVRNSGVNINTSGNGDSCADLKATSSAELAQSADQFRLSRAEVATLELNGATNGVVNVRGWNQDGYGVEVCKFAAAEDRGTADTLLRGISVSRSGGRFTFNGPAGAVNENVSWQVYFIIHTPENASLDLETRNGPISIADVHGNVKVRAVNGPISIRGSNGNIDAQATNGPIAFDGESGEVHLHAQNGPISVKLQKEVWNGPTLEAKTVNGPMSVALPAVFQSGMRVETSGRTPVSCDHDVCTHAYSNTNGGQKVIQINGSSEIVRISTENGPLSIGESRAKPKRVF